MSEWGESKPSRDPGWATSGSQTDPGVAKRAAGYVFQATVPSEELNWLLATSGMFAEWLGRAIERRFDSVAEALGAVELGDIFRVAPGGSGVKGLGEVEQLATTSATLMVTDGARIYTVESGNRLYSRRPHQGMSVDSAFGTYSGFLVWSSSIDQIACDGKYIFVGRSGSYLQGKLAVFNCEDGALDNEVSWPSGGGTIGPIASNGERFIAVVGTDLEWREPDLSPYISNYAHGAAIHAVAIDQDQAYVAGEPSVGGSSPGATVFGLDTSTGAVKWAQTVNVSTNYPRAIVADGEYVYVAVDYQVRKLNRTTGSQIWSRALDDQAERMTVDDRYLYVTEYDSTAQTHIIDKSSGEVVAVIPSTDLNAISSLDIDGLGAYALGQISSTTVIARVWSGAPAKRLMSVSGEDPHRRFHKCAVPVE